MSKIPRAERNSQCIHYPQRGRMNARLEIGDCADADFELHKIDIVHKIAYMPPPYLQRYSNNHFLVCCCQNMIPLVPESSRQDKIIGIARCH